MPMCVAFLLLLLANGSQARSFIACYLFGLVLFMDFVALSISFIVYWFQWSAGLFLGFLNFVQLCDSDITLCNRR